MRDNNPQFTSAQRTPRAALHDSPVHFRAHAPLVDAAKALAALRGMSLAELMRHVLRREIDAANASSSAPHDPDKLSARDTSVRRAAMGDVQAQRQEVLNALLGARGNPHARYEGLRLAEHWARMAALSGGDEDHARLISVLALRIDDCRARGDLVMAGNLEAEAIGIVSVLADEGNEYCASALNAFSDEVTPELMEGAKAFVASWKAAV